MGSMWILPSFTGFYWVLLGFGRALSRFIGLSFSVTQFEWVLYGFYLVLLGFTGFCFGVA